MKMSALKKDVIANCAIMERIDKKFTTKQWKEIKDELNCGVTSVFEIAEYQIKALNKWINNKRNENKIEYDLYDFVLLELETNFIEASEEYIKENNI